MDYQIVVVNTGVTNFLIEKAVQNSTFTINYIEIAYLRDRHDTLLIFFSHVFVYIAILYLDIFKFYQILQS